MKHLNRNNLFIVIVTGVFIAAFQNCSKNGFNSDSSASLSELNSLSGQNPAPSPSPAPSLVANLSINMTGPNDLLSQSSLQTVQSNESLINFKEYVPQYPLYSDGATKRRWVYLPAGTIINTSNPDEWVYPKGTIFFKEFSFGGQKIETRLWEKVADGVGITAWRPSVYAWKADQSDAVRYTGDFYSQAPDVQMQFAAYNVSSQYKMLNTAACIKCHSSANDVVNGFNYLQLSDTAAKVNIFSVKNLNWLSNPPMTADEIKGTAVAKAAIGYIQTNCATCHNGVLHPRNFKHRSNVLDYANENIMLELAKTPPAAMPLITFGDTSKSYIYVRQQARTMPPIGLFVADPEGQRVLAAWINENAGSSPSPAPQPVVSPVIGPVIDPPVISEPPTPVTEPSAPPTSEPPTAGSNPPVMEDQPVSSVGPVQCNAPQLNVMCMPPTGGSGAFLRSFVNKATSASACQTLCKAEMKRALYSEGNYCCEYIPAASTSDSQSICALTAGTWSLVSTSGGNYESALCSKAAR